MTFCTVTRRKMTIHGIFASCVPPAARADAEGRCKSTKEGVPAKGSEAWRRGELPAATRFDLRQKK